MKVKSISFNGVIGVYGKPETLKKVSNALNKTQGTDYFDATNMYKNNSGRGLLTKASQLGNEVALIVTGKEDIHKVNFMEQGWTSLNGISHHIKEVVNLENYDLSSFIMQVKNLGKKETLDDLIKKFPVKVINENS